MVERIESESKKPSKTVVHLNGSTWLNNRNLSAVKETAKRIKGMEVPAVSNQMA
jgi:hypothetical protein